MIRHAPHGTSHFVEGLRAAMGLGSTVSDYGVVVVLLGEGCRGATSTLDRGEAAGHLATLAELGYRVQVERESLDGCRISASDVAPGIDIITRSDLVAMLHTADVTIGF